MTGQYTDNPDAWTGFAAALAEHGLTPPEIIADGKIHRFAGPEDGR